LFNTLREIYTDHVVVQYLRRFGSRLQTTLKSVSFSSLKVSDKKMVYCLLGGYPVALKIKRVGMLQAVEFKPATGDKQAYSRAELIAEHEGLVEILPCMYFGDLRPWAGQKIAVECTVSARSFKGVASLGYNIDELEQYKPAVKAS
jgi:hypothetical protein